MRAGVCVCVPWLPLTSFQFCMSKALFETVHVAAVATTLAAAAGGDATAATPIGRHFC